MRWRPVIVVVREPPAEIDYFKVWFESSIHQTSLPQHPNVGGATSNNDYLLVLEIKIGLSTDAHRAVEP